MKTVGSYSIVRRVAVTSLAGLVILFASSARAQFIEQHAGDLTGIQSGSVAWGDYDGDGKLDILLTGLDATNTPIAKIYHNTGTGFTEAYPGSLTGVYLSSAAWGDYDNDGKLDILLAGAAVLNGGYTAKIYRNTGTSFTEVYPGSLTGVIHASIAWGDYDNDGKLDIVLSGMSASALVTKIYHNTGADFEEVYPGSLTGVYYGSVAWGDYDHDGRLDIAVTGFAAGAPISKIYHNTGMDFIEEYPGSLTAVGQGKVAWGDYDNDGKLDLLSCGNTSNGTPNTVLYHNTGTEFTEVFHGAFPGVSVGTVAWGDYDNDGKLDILLTGLDATNTPIAKIYHNTGTDFAEVYGGSLTGVELSSGAWGDYDNDGKLDILLTGFYLGGPLGSAKLYHNIGSYFQYALLVAVSGGGTVTRDPDRALYESGSAVRLTAMPDSCYRFVNWTGDVQPDPSTQNPITVTMNANKNVRANFVNIGCTAPPGHMVAWWPGDHHAKDIAEIPIGYPNDGTLMNGATYAAGKVGEAFSLDGRDDYVTVPNQSDLNFGTGDFTIDAWIKTADTTLSVIVDKRSWSPQQDVILGYELCLWKRHLSLQLADATGYTNYGSSNPDISDGNWHHIAATVHRTSNPQITLYVDGSARLTALPRLGSVNNDSALTIGMSLADQGDYFPGLIDEVELFNRALDSPEIYSIWNAGSCGKCKHDTAETLVCDSLHVNFAQINNSCCWDMTITNPYWGLYGVTLTGLGQEGIASVSVPSGWQYSPSTPSSAITLTMGNGVPITVGQTTVQFCMASGGPHNIRVDWLNGNMSPVCSDTLTANCYYMDTSSRGSAFNKDFQNNTGDTVNNVEIVLDGDQNVVWHYDNDSGAIYGAVDGKFRYKRSTRILNGRVVTVLTWDDVSVPPDGVVHVGFKTSGDSITIINTCWTKDSVSVAPITQVNLHPDWNTWSETNGIILTNDVNDCGQTPQPRTDSLNIRVSAVEFYDKTQPLASLNNHAHRLPIRRDTSGFIPIVLSPGASDTVACINPPSNARYVVWIIDVDTASSMVSPGRVRDFVQFPIRLSSSFNMAQGWNMVSVPLFAEDNSVSALYPGTVSHAFHYESSRYAITDTVWPNKGYWLKFPTPHAITMSGSGLTTAEVPVTRGWNMIGSLSVPIPVYSITSVPPRIVTGYLYGYTHGYSRCDTVWPGRGYWLKVNQTGTLILMPDRSAEAIAKSGIKIVPTGEMPPGPPDEPAEATAKLPKEYGLEQAYPNPFNPATTIKYRLPVDSKVSLNVYNLLGQVVAELVDEVQTASYRSVVWNAGSVSSGVYFYRLEATSTSDPTKTFTQIKKMLLLK